MWSWIQTSNFVIFIVNGFIKGEIKKPNGQFLDLIVMSYCLARFKLKFRKFWFLPLFLFRLENRVCLSRDVQVTCAIWRTVTRIMTGVGDLLQRTRDDEAQVEYSVTERSRGRVMLCAVCTIHEETRSASFLIEPQNQGRRFVSGLASRLLGRFVSGLASKPL
jgi:hypothetical protein